MTGVFKRQRFLRSGDDASNDCNSTERWVAPRLVAATRAGHLVHFGQSPAWLDRTLSLRKP